MNQPARPLMQHQGPATHCVVNGVALGWLSCTAYSIAMGSDKSTIGARRPTGCDIRRATGDLVGGTTLPQCATAAARIVGVHFEVHTGSQVCTPAYAASAARSGRGFALQGNTSALLHTPHRSTGGGVNHCVWVNEVVFDALGRPTEALAYDPAADGRTAGWGKAASGPQWWPWSLVLAFAAALRPWGDRDARKLGSGKFYAAFGPDTEPHLHSRYGGVRTVPFPDYLVGNAAVGRKSNLRSTPKGPLDASTIINYLPRGARFIAFQKITDGVLLAGSRVWFGNHEGNEWVHESGITGIGGTK